MTWLGRVLLGVGISPIRSLNVRHGEVVKSPTPSFRRGKLRRPIQTVVVPDNPEAFIVTVRRIRFDFVADLPAPKTQRGRLRRPIQSVVKSAGKWPALLFPAVSSIGFDVAPPEVQRHRVERGWATNIHSGRVEPIASPPVMPDRICPPKQPVIKDCEQPILGVALVTVFNFEGSAPVVRRACVDDHSSLSIKQCQIEPIEITVGRMPTALTVLPLDCHWSSRINEFHKVKEVFAWRWDHPAAAGSGDEADVELIRSADSRTREQLVHASKYVGDLEISHEEFLETANAGRRLVDKFGEPALCEWIWESAPGAAATLLVHSAIYGYTAGDYWTAFARQVGVCFDPRQQSVWGQRFRLFARLCGCPIGDENPGLRYVRAILRQAGVPTGCLFDLFDLINQSRLDPALRGKSGLALINAWRQSTSNWSGLDQPVCDFLVERPEVANRWIEAVQALLVDQLPRWPLPARVCEEFNRWRERSPITVRPTRPPRIIYQGEYRPTLILPAQPLSSELSAATVELTIRVNGNAAERMPLFAQGSGNQLSTADQKFQFDPGESYDLELWSNQSLLNHWLLAGVQCPGVLAFRALNGAALDLNGGIPAEEVWFVLSADCRVQVNAVDDGPELITEGPPLLGSWSDYRAELWSLANARRIVLTGPSSERIVRIRQVLRESSQLEGGLLVRDAASDPQQVALYAESPHCLMLPGSLTTDGALVQLRRQRDSGAPAEIGKTQIAGSSTGQDVVLPLSELGLTPQTLGQYWLDVRTSCGNERLSFKVVPQLHWSWDPKDKAYFIDVADGVVVRTSAAKLLTVTPVNSPAAELNRYHIQQLNQNNSSRLEFEVSSEKSCVESVSVVLRIPQWMLIDQYSSPGTEVWERNDPVVTKIEEIKYFVVPQLIVEPGDMIPRNATVVSARLEIEGSPPIAIALPEYQTDRLLISVGHQMDTLTRDETRNASIWLRWRTDTDNRICVFLVLGKKLQVAELTDLQKAILITVGMVPVDIDGLVRDLRPYFKNVDFGALNDALDEMPAIYIVRRNVPDKLSLELFTFYRVREHSSWWNEFSKAATNTPRK